MFDFFYLGARQPGYPVCGRAVSDAAEAHDLCRTRFFWLVLGPSDLQHWDFAWEPPPWEAGFRHAWPSQWHPDSGVYLVPKKSSEHTRYHQHPQITRLPQDDTWWFPNAIDMAQWDTSWHPDYRESAYEYHFGTQWQVTGGAVYHGHAGIKIMDQPRATAIPHAELWYIPETVDAQQWDTSWHPDVRDQAYRYEFGTQWHDRGGPVYQPHRSTTKYVSWPRATTVVDHTHWQQFTSLQTHMDHSWIPHPNDPPYIYVFGNQWWNAEIMPTVEYHVPGAQQRKFVLEPRACIVDTQPDRWQMILDCEWDHSWVPDPGDPPYIYVFGNQWWNAEIMPTVKYCMPGAVQIKYVDQPRAQLLPDTQPWHIPPHIDADAVDYTWRPNPHDPPYVYHFGTDLQDAVGVTYTVPGATHIKIAGMIPTVESTTAVTIMPDVFYIDHNNALSEQRFTRLRVSMPSIQRVRYAVSAMDTIKRCHRRATTSLFWVISSHNDYQDFDFAWHPATWQYNMIHVFGTQWNKWSDTFLINSREFERQIAWQTNMQDMFNLNFVEDQRVCAATDAVDIIVIDHGNVRAVDTLVDLRGRTGRVVRTARYVDNYLDTLRRAITQDITADHVWICSTLCDYQHFDFSWQPEAWQRNMMHVFASNNEKFGDTFLVPVARWNQQNQDLTLLDWFETINYVKDISVPRWPMPVVRHCDDSHVHEIQTWEWNEPAAIFVAGSMDVADAPVINFWRGDTKSVLVLDRSASVVVVPREAASMVRTQVYDYPHIDRDHEHHLDTALQCVMFISYDEPQADENWERLRDRCSRAQRIHGVQGIEAAKRAAALASTTPWFYVLFAKTQLAKDFEFDFVPDYLQAPKHYIFHCHNVVNDLEYGHMGIVMYNRAMVLSADPDRDVGLDYTLSFPHEVVPVVSCVGTFNITPYHTWRTAFREASKLAYFEHRQSTIEGAWRLQQWLHRAHGDHAEWCLQGARDGVAFFQETQGDLQQLRRCFDWQWLRERFVGQHGKLE